MVARTPNSVIALAVGVLAACLGLTPPGSNSALAQTSNSSSVTAWFNRNGSSGNTQPAPPPVNANKGDGPIRKFSAKVKKAFSGNPQKTTSIHPKPKTEDDALSLTKPAKPRPDFYISLGRIQERSNNPTAAVEQYKHALELDPNNLTALMALARLYDRQGQFEDALAQYKQATIAHPKESAAFNDQGLCYARHQQYPEAVACLRKAVELHPDRVLYRNNLATMLVETGQIDQAFQVLSAAHGSAVAHYNIGFLLNKRGETAQALEQFKLAVASDAKLEAAGQWVDTLTTKLAAEQNGGPRAAGRQPSLMATKPVTKTDIALAEDQPSLPAVKAAAPPVVASPAEPPVAASKLIASAEMSATPVVALPPTPTPTVTPTPTPTANAAQAPLPGALAIDNGASNMAGLGAASVTAGPPPSSVAVRDVPAESVTPLPALSAKPSPAVPPLSPGSQLAPRLGPSIVHTPVDQGDNGQLLKRAKRDSRPTELVAERPTRLPPTPDEIQVYSQNVPPVNAANVIVPLPPVDPAHYPAGRY